MLVEVGGIYMSLMRGCASLQRARISTYVSCEHKDVVRGRKGLWKDENLVRFMNLSK